MFAPWDEESIVIRTVHLKVRIGREYRALKSDREDRAGVVLGRSSLWREFVC